MNYIAEIRAFYDWLPFNSIPADAQALWHVLMHLNNKCAVNVNGEWLWRVEFTVSNSTLLSNLGFSRTQLDRMKNVLIQSGRIRYRKGKGNQSGAYQMIPFDAHYVAQPVTQTGAQTVTQMWRNLCTLNNYNNTATSNFLSDDGDGARVVLQEQFFGMTPETEALLRGLAAELIPAYWGRQPTEWDVCSLCKYVTRREWGGEETPGIHIDGDKLGLMKYAFQASADAGVRRWDYLDGILARCSRRGLHTADACELYDAKGRRD